MVKRKICTYHKAYSAFQSWISSEVDGKAESDASDYRECGHIQNYLSHLRQYFTLILSRGKDHTHGLDFFLWEHPSIKSARLLRMLIVSLCKSTSHEHRHTHTGMYVQLPELDTVSKYSDILVTSTRSSQHSARSFTSLLADLSTTVAPNLHQHYFPPSLHRCEHASSPPFSFNPLYTNPPPPSPKQNRRSRHLISE